MKKIIVPIFLIIAAISAISGCGSNGIVPEENSAVIEVSNTDNISDSVATNDVVYSDEPTTGTLNGHDWVDLGLPSGTKWATCNIGATKSEDYGDYYAWGETKPKKLYDWSTYRHYRGCDCITKYCIEDGRANYPNSDLIDNLINIEDSDDAATANWGKGWRMPTLNEIIELSWCQLEGGIRSIKCISLNGVNGRLFTGTNGNSIFIPCAGYIIYDTLKGVDSIGCCWSNELREINHTMAWSLGFEYYSDECRYTWDYRCLGFPIRPVCN